MKFKLVESIDDRLVEKTDPYKEVAKHAFADANTKSYTLKGLKSIVLKRYDQAIQKLCFEVMNENKDDAEVFFKDVISDRWELHHINGIHKDSSTSDLDNLALTPKAIHERLTSENEVIAKNLFLGSRSLTGIEDADKLIFRLLVILKANNRNPSDIFRIKAHDVYNAVNKELPEKARKNFYDQYPKSCDEALLLKDLAKYLK